MLIAYKAKIMSAIRKSIAYSVQFILHNDALIPDPITCSHQMIPIVQNSLLVKLVERAEMLPKEVWPFIYEGTIRHPVKLVSNS